MGLCVPDAKRSKVNEIIAYHAPISRALTDERTSLESKLIPVTAYIVTACVEAWYRYPDLMRQIDAVMPATEIGRRARRPGCRVNSVYLWSIANFWLIGRKVMSMALPGADLVEPAHAVLDFWERAALAFRGDGTRQAFDTGTVTPYSPQTIAELLAGTVPVAADQLSAIKKFNATLVAYLFLLYFDTRVGSGDTGPYHLPDGRVLLVRDYYHLAKSDFPWSDVAAGVPYQNLTAAFVLDGVQMKVTDFGTSYTDPEDYLDRLVAFGLFATDPHGTLRELPLTELEGIVVAVRRAQAALYRNIANMDRDAKIRCGAYVYFSFLRPFAEEAGLANEIDWSVPRDTPEPLYQLFSAMEGTNAATIEDGPYYAPLA